jgi:hypothetical protein
LLAVAIVCCHFIEGYHELEVHCWRPSGSIKDELQSFFLGTSSCLVDEEVIFGKAWEKRGKLKTVTSGIVSCRMLKCFDVMTNNQTLP